MRKLKTKFPCMTCGVPAEVERLRDGPKASCEPCSKRLDALRRIGIADWASDRAVRDEAEESVSLLIKWLKAAEHRTVASYRSLEALSVATPGDLALLVRMARNRAKWACDVIMQLAPFFEDALTEAKSKRPLQVVEGGAETPAETVPPPELTLLRLQRKDGDT